jgi:carboxyl-terminal processing protease
VDKVVSQIPVADAGNDIGDLRNRLTPAEVPKPDLIEPNVVEFPELPSNVIETACQLIYQGKFDVADELLKQTKGNISGEPNSGSSAPDERGDVVRQISGIIHEYQALNQQRQSARQAAYQQQLADLEKFQTARSTNDINNLASTTDVNDANNTTVVLSTIAKASELASVAQRKELIANSFVKEIFQKVIDKAAELELKGKWLDAYISCYAWLQAIDPNNKAYSDYANQLIDKASIVASFQDSPCETSQERFQGIKKEMFIRAIEALNANYVSTIDYSKMASDAAKRCQLLAEVMATSFSRNLLPIQSANKGSEISFTPPDVNELNAWSVALAAVLDEIKSTSEEANGFTKDKFIEVFERVLSLNNATVQLPRPALIAQFAEAAFAALDPYTVMVWPREVNDFEKMMTNEFTGIGIEISKPKGLLTVSSLLPDTPAYKSGLDAEDVIAAVDGVETKDMTLICAVHKITGPKGTKVTLTIKRSGEDKTRDITITRAKITVPSIRGWQRIETGDWLYMIDQQNKIGYVRLTSFSADTSTDLDKILRQLEKDGLKGLILDLRFNSGGLLESAVDVADQFIKEGLIVRTQPGFGRTPTFKPAHEKGTHPDYPLAILINYSSASASEIVAGALADKTHNRAVLVGERTHGKGSVQGITEYTGGGSQLKYTMAYYHLPSGQRVKSRDAVEKQGGKDWGVGPNIEVELTSDELKKMLDIQRDNEVLVQADRGERRQSPKRHTFQETLAADPQLAVAMLVVKAKLAEADIKIEKKDVTVLSRN